MSRLVLLRLPARALPTACGHAAGPCATARAFSGVQYRPMTVADRVMAEAVERGELSGLEGEGRPLSGENSQAHVAALPKNMEARAEAEMRRYARAGLLDSLGGQGEPLPEERALHGAGTGGAAQSIIQRKVGQEMKK
jgi:hypothetical protein